MPTDNEDRRREPGPDDRDYLPGVPNRIRNLIARADELALQQLTPAEYERMADAEQSIERLDSAKKELVLKVLARHETDWRLRLTPFEKICLDRGDGTEGSFQVSARLERCSTRSGQSTMTWSNASTKPGRSTMSLCEWRWQRAMVAASE